MRLILILLLLPLPALAQDAIGRVNVGGFNARSMCSGALVRADLVLTAAHCVARADGTLKPLADMVFVAAWDGAGHAGAARVKAVELDPDAYATGRLDLRHDMALLVLTDPLDITPLRVGLKASGPYALAGYNRTRPHRLQQQGGCAGAPDRGVLRLACAIAEGQSGGPVLAGAGDARRLVAVLSARAQDAALAAPVNNWLRRRLASPYTP